MRTITKIQAGCYAIALPKAKSGMVWLEGEGTERGKWFFDLGNGNGTSEPYRTLSAAYAAMRVAYFENWG